MLKQKLAEKLKQCCQVLWRKPNKWYLLGIPFGGFLMFVLGSVFLAGFVTTVSWSNSLEFCTSCHEMRDTVFQEYKQTVHYQNASGVRAICSDCHVPKEWLPKMKVKIKASFNELPKHFLGTVGTVEKFETQRAEMAKHVQEKMRQTDSRECRNCHNYETMVLALQDRSAAKKHSLEWRKQSGDTCIDCHQGIAHKLPGED